MKEIEFVCAGSNGIIEYGYVEVEIGGEYITIQTEQYSGGGESYYVDTLEDKEILQSAGIEFDTQSVLKIDGPEELLIDLFDYYVSETTRNR
jgi:hypothetical protein